MTTAKDFIGDHIVDGKIFFDKVTTSKFVGRKAQKGKTYSKIQLYEADNPDELIQFYQKKSIDFTREMRRISTTYKFDKNRLQLK